MSRARALRRALWGGTLAVLLSSQVQALEPLPARALGFESGVRGLVAEGAVGTSAVGDSLLFALGGAWQGIQSLKSERWLLQWDALLALRGGYLANQHPYLFLLGGRMASFAEAGYRFRTEGELTPYTGLRLGSEQQVLVHPGRALADQNQFNAVDGVGGLVVHGSARLAGGASWLTRERSLLLVAFLGESFQDLQVNTEALTLSDLGLAARYDHRSGLSAGFECAGGLSPYRTDALRGLRDRTRRVSLAANFRWVFQQSSWLAASASLARDSDHLAYANGRSYDTSSAPVLALSVVFGLSLERRPP